MSHKINKSTIQLKKYKLNITDDAHRAQRLDPTLTERSKVSCIQEPEEEVNQSRLSEYAPIMVLSEANIPGTASHKNKAGLPNI